MINTHTNKVESVTPILSRLDNVMKQISRLNNIISLDDKFNHLYIKEVLEESISSGSYKQQQTDHIIQSIQNINPMSKKKVQQSNRKIGIADKNSSSKTKIPDTPNKVLKAKKHIGIEATSQRIRTKTDQKTKICQNMEIKTRSSIKSPVQYSNQLKLLQLAKQKKKNTARGINTSSNSQQSMSNAKKTLRRPPSSKWLNKKSQLGQGNIEKSQRGVKLNKMNLNKYRQTIKKITLIKDLNGLDQKYHLNLNESKSYMQRLIQKLHNEETYQQQTGKYMNTVAELNPNVIFKQLDYDFDTNSDLLKTLMIFISQFSEKVTKQLTDAFTKSNMKFDALVKNTVKIILELPSLLYKRNEISETKFRQYMKQTEGLSQYTNNGSTIINSLIALKQYLQFLFRNSLIQITERSEVYRASKEIDYYSQRNQTNRLEKIESPRQKSGKKCQTERKPVMSKQNSGCQFNQTKKISSKQRVTGKPKIKNSMECLSKQHIF